MYIPFQRMIGKGPKLERYDEYLDYLRELERKFEAGEPLPKNQMSHEQWLRHEKGSETICVKCQRPIDPWPLRRPAKCSPKDWFYCIRNDQAVQHG